MKSPVRDDASQGICLPLVSSFTPLRTFLNTCSIGTPGMRMFFSKWEVYNSLIGKPLV